ncbi:MAG: ATP-binding protein [Metallibacterium scheffleri]|jgi:two-component system sensor histidine kinase RegB|uniref:ATP-binding protein n=1 Tax=Metallibacterium scheffleri TaxID=993689 RepID=UPI0026EAF544|nr:ATP-binding protein [Metallibacterium scheffleri]MCK9365985.1 ATP-binding protein [Metallibacterium scheffleri]
MPARNATANRGSSPFRLGPRTLAITLAWLRLTAITGQTLAVLFVAYVVALAIPVRALLAGIGVLLVFEIAMVMRLRLRWPVTEVEAIGHIAVDVLVMGYLLYFSGGASNPFVTLLLVPIALAAAALSRPGIAVVAVLCAAIYGLLLHWYLPLPAMLAGRMSDSTLQEIGMAIDFVIAALLLGVFIARLAGALRDEQLRLQRLRERALRDEGILAMATQSAGAAHELNTPLATLRMLLHELIPAPSTCEPLREDLKLMAQQVDRCSEILRDLVAVGRAQLDGDNESLRLGDFVRRCTDRFQLLRPEADTQVQLDAADADLPVRVPAGLQHALINLLNNALDASAQLGSTQVALSARRGTRCLEFRVRDHGPGFADSSRSPDSLGVSGKDHGLGIGLALAEATADRLGGDLDAGNATGGGAEIRLRLPLLSLLPEQQGKPVPTAAHCNPEETS